MHGTHASTAAIAGSRCPCRRRHWRHVVVVVVVGWSCCVRFPREEQRELPAGSCTLVPLLFTQAFLSRYVCVYACQVRESGSSCETERKREAMDRERQRETGRQAGAQAIMHERLVPMHTQAAVKRRRSCAFPMSRVSLPPAAAAAGCLGCSEPLSLSVASPASRSLSHSLFFAIMHSLACSCVQTYTHAHAKPTNKQTHALQT